MSKLYVSAKSQAQTLETLIEEPWFTEEEMDILKRGRNAKSYTKAKNTDVQTYRKSSALEAVIGFLYLEHREERLKVLLDKIIEIVNGGREYVEDIVIVGRHAVKEAIISGHSINKILIQDGIKTTN